jgi:ferritin-like metal-binding protein YciE
MMNQRDSVRALYASELRDLRSATEQFSALARSMRDGCHDADVRQLLAHAASRSLAHADVLKTLASEADPRSPCEPCQGMRWLVIDAVRQVRRASHHGEVSGDREMLNQYQRLSHYHLARLGTAASYARGLSRAEHANELVRIVADINEEELHAQQLSLALSSKPPPAP